MGITIRDVAEAAGVSTATVSRALRDLANVDPQTRAKVKRIAADLDYVTSPSASRLASGRTGSIAVITPYIARWFFSTVLSGVEPILQAADMDLLLICVDDPYHPQRVPPARRLRRRVDGMLVIALPTEEPSLHELISMGLPMSLIGVTMEGVPSVSIDDIEAARKATQHLVNLGHERIGLIAGTPVKGPFTAEADRVTGYREVLRSAGLQTDPTLEAYGYFTIKGGEHAMTSLLTRPNRPSAVFAMSDEMAFGALRAIESHGLRVGRDIAIVGVDGHDMSEFLGLSTVEQPVRELGRIAAEALVAQISNREAPHDPITLPTILQVRSSTSPRRAD